MVVLLGLLSILLVPVVTIGAWWVVWFAKPSNPAIAYRTLGVTCLGLGAQFIEAWIVSPALLVSGLGALIVGCFWQPRSEA